MKIQYRYPVAFRDKYHHHLEYCETSDPQHQILQSHRGEISVVKSTKGSRKKKSVFL